VPEPALPGAGPLPVPARAGGGRVGGVDAGAEGMTAGGHDARRTGEPALAQHSARADDGGGADLLTACAGEPGSVSGDDVGGPGPHEAVRHACGVVSGRDVDAMAGRWVSILVAGRTTATWMRGRDSATRRQAQPHGHRVRPPGGREEERLVREWRPHRPLALAKHQWHHWLRPRSSLGGRPPAPEVVPGLPVADAAEHWGLMPNTGIGQEDMTYRSYAPRRRRRREC
jgi:hypothetical protein